MSKKLIISLVAVGIVVAVVLILFWTLFALSSVTVDFQSTLVNLDVSAQEIVDAGEFRFGACVLFEGKKNSVQKIYDKAREDPKFAYIRVVNIETVFPNKFVIHVAEREELFAVEHAGQTLICDRDLRVLRVLEGESIAEKFENETSQDVVGQNVICSNFEAASESDGYVSTSQNPIQISGLEIENQTVSVGDFLKIEPNSMKNFYASFIRNNRSLSEVVGKFEKVTISKYVEEVTNVEYAALTLLTFEGREFVIKNPEFAFAHKVALLYAVESALFSQNVDESGNILDADGQPIYLVKNEKRQYLLAEQEGKHEVGEEPEEQVGNEKVALTFALLQKCQIVIDNLTLSDYTYVSENDLYFYLQEKM